MAEVINIATFEFDMDRLTKSIDDYQKRLFELQKEQKRYSDQNKNIENQMKKLAEAKELLVNSGQEESEQYKEVELRMKSLNAQQEQVFKNQKNLQIESAKVRGEYNQSVKAQQALMTSTGKLQSSTDAYTAALNREVKSKADAKQSNSELIKLADQLDLTIEGNIEVLEKLNEKIDKNTNFLKANSSEMQQQQMNIGNYKSAFSEAANELNIFNGGLAGFAERSAEAGGSGALMTNSLKSMTSATVGLTKSMLSFIATPIGAILAVIVGAILLVKNAMDRNEESANKIKVAFSAFSGILNTVLKALEPLGEFLIDGIVVGFELAGKAAETAMGIISSGLELLGFDDAAKSLNEFTGEIKQGVKEAQELAIAEQNLEKQQRKARLTQLEYQKQAEKLRQIRDDESRSIAERIKANDELGAVLKRQLQEELAIAQAALEVVNLRIKAEGATSALLDAQADALTEIADIQERITGQESEQLTNRVALQKEAHEKYMEQVEKAINKQKELIDLYIAEQGVRAKTLQEQLEIDREVAKKSIAVLDAELKAKKISQEAYATEKLNILNELAYQESELMVDNAKRELDVFLKNQDTILSERKRLLGDEVNILNEKQNAELQYQATRLQQGIIAETEYQDSILAIKEQYKQKEVELNTKFEEQQKADRELKDQLETEARLLNLETNAWTEFERNQIIADEQYAINQAKLEEQKAQGLISEENYLLAKKNLDKSYAQQSAEIERLKQEYKLQVASQTFGNLAAIAGKESAAGKAFAIAQTTIDTYQSATAAFKSFSGMGPWGVAAGIAAAAAAVASGIANVKKIASTKTPGGSSSGGSSSGGGVTNQAIQRFAGGGTVTGGIPTFQNNGDNVLVSAKIGETFLNDSQRGFIGNDILSMAGVPGFSASNSTATQNNVSSSGIGGSSLAETIADAVYKGSLLGTNQGSQKGMLDASENRTIRNQSTFG